MASTVEPSIAMNEDCSMSETEDGELIDDPPEIPVKVQSKLELRAKRFGIVHSEPIKSSHPDKSIQKLYNSMGVTSETRLEALHLFGIDSMKTQDVFAYFEPTPPTSVEWITDKTCNAVWLDETSCAKSLTACSIRIKILKDDENSSESDDDEEFVREEDLRLSLPPGIWRKGHSKPYAPNIFLRFATRQDRRNKNDKVPPYMPEFTRRPLMFPDQGDEQVRKVNPDSVNPWSDIARQWGNFEKRVSAAVQFKRERNGVGDNKMILRDARELLNKKEVRDLETNWDAREKLSSDRSFSPELEQKNERLFGKMRADIEEKKIMDRSLKTLKRNLQENDLRQRLGQKRSRTSANGMRDDDPSDEEDSKSDTENGKNIKKRLGDTTWISYGSDKSDDLSEDDGSGSSDLRQKLSKGSKPFIPHSPLRIEIDNDMYYSGNSSEGDSDSS